MYIYTFIYLDAPGLSCSIWDLVPSPGIEPGPPALGAQSVSQFDHQGSPNRPSLYVMAKETGA